MDQDSSLKIVREIKQNLETTQDLQHELSQLSNLIGSTRSNVNLLQSLSNSSEVWQIIRDIIEYGTTDTVNIEELTARVIRGVIVLARNLITNNQSLIDNLNSLILKYLSRLAENQTRISDNVKINTLHSSLEYLANFTQIKQKFPKGLVGLLNDSVSKYPKLIKADPECVSLLFTVLENMIKDDDEVTTEALSQAQGKFILELLLNQFEQIDFEKHNREHETLTSLDLQIMKISKLLITHESFLKFITVHNDDSNQTYRYLKIAQVVITSVSQWDIFHLTVILSWTFEHLQYLSTELQSFFKLQDLDSKKDLASVLYSQLSTILDIYTHLTIFEHTKKFLDSYQGLDLLLTLLSTLHTNIKPLKLKDSERSSSHYQIPDDHFPGCKSLLIEILSQLTHGNHTIQEQIRQKHGLELILSCTNIDDNEPFIKERAIVCLRFLLLGNEGNQKFVAALEARQVLDKKVVEDVGYDVEIKDGKVQLKRKEKIKEMEEHIVNRERKRDILEDVDEEEGRQ